MKTTLTFIFTTLLLVGCQKEQPTTREIIDTSKNPQLISVSINNNTSEIIRVR